MKNINRLLKSGFWVLVGAIILSSCDADVEIDRSFDEIMSAQPTISTFSPQSATVLEEVTIEGTFLNFVTKAYVGDVEAQITQRVNSKQLRIEIPPQAIGGKIKLITQAGMEVISTDDISVQYPVPVITSEVPEESIVNENIILEGEFINVVTKVTFGGAPGIIEYKDQQSIVVKTPNNINSPMDLEIWYYTAQGEVSTRVQESYSIIIPKPIISAWPRIMSRYQDITVTGENMNLIESVSIGGVITSILSASANNIIFSSPQELETGFYDIKFTYAEVEEVSKTNIPYINGQLETYYDWDTDTADASDIDLSKDPLAFDQVNRDVPQPPLPEGTGYYHLEMGTATGSTIGRMKFHETSSNSTWQNILDEGNFNNNPVLHFWVNTEGTKPILKIYIGGTGNPNRRELPGGNLNNGDEWKLIAIRLKDFIPDLDSTGSVMEFRWNTGSSASDLPIKVNLDWVIVTDQVLTEFGAVDVTDEFKPAG